MSFLAPMAISAGAGLLGNMFGGGGDAQDASQAAMAQERQAVARALGLLKPFQGAGQFGITGLEGMLGQDPTDVVNKIGAQFQQSPFEKFRSAQAQKGLESQLAGAGLAGSGEAIQRSGQLSQQLAGQGQEQFLKDVLGQRQQKQQGLEGLFSGGLSAAQTGAGLLGQEGQTLGGLAGAGILGQGQEKSGLLGGLGSLAGLFSGGGMFGGGGGGMPGFGGGGIQNLFGGNKRFTDPDSGIPFDPSSLLPGII